MVHILIGHGKLWLCTWTVDRFDYGCGISTVRIYANAKGTVRNMIHLLSLLAILLLYYTFIFAPHQSPQTKVPLFQAFALIPISTAADAQSSPWL